MEETRIKWEEEMSNCCVLFEGLEINRITKMKDLFDEYSRSEDKVPSQCCFSDFIWPI